MFKNLSQRLSSVFDSIRGRGFISEDDINKAVREIRIALLEADVALPVVKEFIEQLKERALGQEVTKSISPGQMIIKIVHDHLIDLLGGIDDTQSSLNLAARSPISILMVGLQGSGKTTSTGKLAKHLYEKLKKRVLLVSLDIYRPAAQHQLAVLANAIGVESLAIIEGEKPLDIIKRAKIRAKEGSFDVVLYDTAGRLHIDDMLMDEIKQIHNEILPLEVLLVADAMTGQDAVSIANGFKNVLPITGLILTRIDGDSRGGAALSMRSVTKCPIKFLGVGEKSENLEVFNAKRMADRILDMGDIVALVEQAGEMQVSKEMEASAKRMEKGLFNMNDMASQLQQMLKMGGISSMISFIPGAGKIKDKLDNAGMSDKLIKRQIAIINSMTAKERKNIDILNASRRKRIALGSGVDVADVNKLIKQYQQMETVIKRIGKMGKTNPGKMAGMLQSLFKG